MLISLIDPNDSAVFGHLFNEDGIRVEELLAGTPINFFFSSTGSDDNAELFDLSEPPSFLGPPMVWASIQQQDTLALFLASMTGDDTYPFAELPDIRNLSGQGNLIRSNKLPAVIDWAVTP